MQKSYTKTLMCAIFMMALLNMNTVYAEISIIEPATDPFEGNITTSGSKMIVTVKVNDTNVSKVQAHLLYQPWNQLEKESSTVYSGVLDISNLPNGNYKLSAYYLRTGEDAAQAHYISQPTLITINRPAPPVIVPITYDVIIQDTSSIPIEGVKPFYIGTPSDSTGLIHFTDLTLNSNYNVRLNKTGYLDYSLQFTPTKNNETKTVTMRKPSDNLKTMAVSGINTAVPLNTVSYIRVKDSQTLEYLSDATVTLFVGSQIKSMPGDTVGGRVTVGFNEPGEFDLLIEKAGYKDYTETITVVAPKVTPTPTPTPAPVLTPVPTPQKRACDAANGISLTDDDCRLAIDALEIKKAQESQTTAANNTPMVDAYINQQQYQQQYQQPPSEGLPINTLALLGVVGIGGIYFIKRKPKTQDTVNVDSGLITDAEFNARMGIAPEAQVRSPISPVAPVMEKLTCNKCPWEYEVSASMDETFKKAIKQEHEKGHDI